MTFRPEAVPAFLALFAAAKARIETQPGCRSVRLWRDSADPAILATYSLWESETALNQYRRSELFGAVWPRTKALFAAPAQTFSFEEA